MYRLLRLFVLALALLCGGVAPAYAQDADRDAARALAEAGFTFYEKGNYAKALERFESAEKLFHAPPHLLFIARCQSKLGKTADARKTYERLASESLPADSPQAFRDAQQEAKDELKALEANIPTITVDVTGPEPGAVTLTVAGQPATLGSPVTLKPGTFDVAASADGFASASQSVTLTEGSHEQVSLTLVALGGSEVEPPTPDGPDTGGGDGPGITLPLIVAGLGGVGLLIGAITGGLALGKADDLKAACPTRTGCAPEDQDLEDSARSLGTVSTVSFVVGGLLAAGGVVWLVVVLTGDDGAEETPSAIRFATDGTLGIEGSF